MKTPLLIKTILAAVGLCVGTSAWADSTIITYDLTGKFSGSSTACTLTDSKITTPAALADELNKNATYTITWSGSPRAKGDGTGIDVSTADNGTFTITGLSGGEEIIVRSHALNDGRNLTVAKGQKCIVEGVDVETTSAKTVANANGTYNPIYMKAGATSLTVTSASKFTILKSVSIITPDSKFTRNVNYGDANIWTSADLTAWNAGNGFSIDVPASNEDADPHYGLGIDPNGQSGSRTATKTFGLSHEGSKVKYVINWYFGGAPGAKDGNYNSLYLKLGNNICLSWNQTHSSSSSGSYYAVHITKDGTCSTESDYVLQDLNKANYYTKEIVIVFNRKTKTVERFTFGGTDYTSKVTGTFDESFNNITLGFERKGLNGSSSKNYITSMSVTEYSQSFPYTICYTYSGSTIKSEESTAVVGSTVDATYTSFWNDGNTQKYYVTNDATTSLTIAEDVNKLNVDLRQAASDAVAAISVVDSEDTEMATISETGIEGEAVTLYYPHVVKYNERYYVIDTDNYSVSTTYGAAATKKVYTLDESIVAYTEGEGSGYRNVAASNNSAYSGGDYVNFVITGNGIATNTRDRGFSLGTLPAGVYQLVVYVVNTTKKRSVAIRNSNDTTDPIVYVSNTDQITGELTANFTLTGSTTLLVNGTNADNGKSNQIEDLDYVLIRQIPVSATLGTNGYTTFSSAYPLALGSMTASTGEVTAYYAKAVGDGKVKLTSISDNVEAGEGLILKGTAGATVTIPVAASGDAIDNYLVGCPTATELTTPNSNYYVMVNSGAGIEFQSLTGSYTDNKVTIPAGKAYLNVASAGARLSISFDDAVTGVADVRSKRADVRGEYYNLSGQRVAQPTKGLYIVNGKKVIKN